MEIVVLILFAFTSVQAADIQKSSKDPNKLIIIDSSMNDDMVKSTMGELPYQVVYRDGAKAVVCMGKMSEAQQIKVKTMVTAAEHTICVNCLLPQNEVLTQQASRNVDDGNAAADLGRNTYSRDVAPILERHCITCHQPGGIGMKSGMLINLVGFQNVRPWARAIRQAVLSNRMPHGASWIPGIDKTETSEDDCGDENRFKSMRFLTQDEKQKVADWVADTSAPVGVPEDIPCPHEIPKSEGWMAGEPDIVLSQIDGGYKVSAAKDGEPHDQFRNFILPKGKVTNTKFIQQIEFQPGNPEGRGGTDKFPVVHHAHLFIDQSACDDNGRPQPGVKSESTLETEKALEMARQGSPPGTVVQSGYDTRSVPFAIVGSWFPGAGPIRFGNNAAVELRPCDQLVLQMHYTKYKQEVLDETKIGITLAKDGEKIIPIRNITVEKTKQAANPGVVESPSGLASIPYNSNNFAVSLGYKFDRETKLFGVGPHQHQLGTKHNVYLECPNRPRQCIYNGKWDFDHQSSHFLNSPITVPAGCSLKNQCTYRLNAVNTLGTKTDVEFGPNAENEMCRTNYFVQK